MKRIAILMIGGALAMAALAGCASAYEGRPAPGPVAVAPPHVMAAPQPGTQAFVDYCMRIGIQAFNARMAVGPASPIKGAEASLAAREAVAACVAPRGARGARWSPPGGSQRHDDPG